MKKYLKFSLLALLALGMQTSCGSQPTSSQSEASESELSSSSSSDPICSGYGFLEIEDMVLYTNFPDTPIVRFSNPSFECEIDYFIEDSSIVTYVDGYFQALKAGTTTVEAITDYHSTTFTINAKVYSDSKGETQTNWYLNRVASVERKWINEGRQTGGILFIGDSFFDTEFWSNFYTTYAGSNAYTTGVSSSTTTDWEIFGARLIYPIAPSNIVMHCGSNNVWDDNESAATASSNIQKLMKKIHSRLPETKIYYFAIEPRTYPIGFNGTFNEFTYNLITEINNTMKTYCEENDNLVFVDATSYCYTSSYTVNSSFFRDGTHPTLDNYMVYCRLLKEAGLELDYADTTNTRAFDIAQTNGALGGTTNIKSDGVSVVKNYAVSGKFKVSSFGGNPHIEFGFDNTHFNNRFLLWDFNQQNGGILKPGYAVSGDHITNATDTEITLNQEVNWELVTTEKHSYLYINGTLELVYLNLNPTIALMISAQDCAVSFYDINTITPSNDSTSWANVLARTEIANYEASVDTTIQVVTR